MKKVLFLISAILGLGLCSNALASITVTNSTGQKIFLYTDHGKKFDKLFPGETRECSYTHCDKFNVLVKDTSSKRLKTVCTITPAADNGSVRITQILADQNNGGCHSFYQYKR